MTKFKTALASAAVAGFTLYAVGATARPAPVSDTAYFQAERCQALMSSAALGKQDTHGIDAFLRTQSGMRGEAAYELGMQAHDRAASEARSAGGDEKARLIAERDGACRSTAALSSSETGHSGGE